MPVRHTRRDALRAGGTAVLAGFAGCIAIPGDGESGTDDGGDWPQAGAGPANAGHAPGADGPDASGVAWRFDGPLSGAARAPVLVDDTVFASGRGAVRALDAATGERRRSFDRESPPGGRPAYADGRLFLADLQGRCRALDAADGSTAWRRDLEQGVRAAPAVADGTVVLATWGAGPSVDAGETAPAVVALDAASGDELWRFGRFHDDDEILAGPAVAGGTVYAASREGRLFALDAATGDRLWYRHLGNAVLAAPAVADGRLYVATAGDGAVRAFDAGTGEWLWAAGLAGREVRASPAVARGRVYATATHSLACPGRCDGTDPVGYLHALDAGTGDQRWRRRTDAATTAGPVVVDGRVYVGRGADVAAVDATTGEQRWAATLRHDGGRSAADSWLAVGRGRAYVADGEGVVYALGDG